MTAVTFRQGLSATILEKMLLSRATTARESSFCMYQTPLKTTRGPRDRSVAPPLRRGREGRRSCRRYQGDENLKGTKTVFMVRQVSADGGALKSLAARSTSSTTCSSGGGSSSSSSSSSSGENSRGASSSIVAGAAPATTPDNGSSSSSVSKSSSRRLRARSGPRGQGQRREGTPGSPHARGRAGSRDQGRRHLLGVSWRVCGEKGRRYCTIGRTRTVDEEGEGSDALLEAGARSISEGWAERRWRGEERSGGRRRNL